jgi:hypothetical protein
VHEARDCCIVLLGANLTPQQRSLIAIPLYHQNFPANAIFDTFRAVLMETIGGTDFQTKHSLTQSDIQSFSGILAAISGEYGDLLKARNNLLHCTWYIGYRGSDDPDASTFSIVKFTTRQTGYSGLNYQTPLPVSTICASGARRHATGSALYMLAYLQALRTCRSRRASSLATRFGSAFGLRHIRLPQNLLKPIPRGTPMDDASLSLP